MSSELDWEASRAMARAEAHIDAEVASGPPPAAPVTGLVPGDRVLYRGVLIRCELDPRRRETRIYRIFRGGYECCVTYQEDQARAYADGTPEATLGASSIHDYESLASWCARHQLGWDSATAMYFCSEGASRLIDGDPERFMRLVRALAVRA